MLAARTPVCYKPAAQHTTVHSYPGTDQAEALLAASPAGQAPAPAVLIKMQQQLCSAGRQAVAPQLQHRRALHTRHTWLVSDTADTYEQRAWHLKTKSLGQHWSPHWRQQGQELLSFCTCTAGLNVAGPLCSGQPRLAIYREFAEQDRCPTSPHDGVLKVLQVQRVLQHALPRTAPSLFQLGWHLHVDLCGLLQPRGLLLQRPWHSSCGESG